MEAPLITTEVFRQFASCEYKAHIAARKHSAGNERMLSLIATRAERAKQAWMETQQKTPFMATSISERRVTYRDLEAIVDYAELADNPLCQGSCRL